jgi:hypothetical protein
MKGGRIKMGLDRLMRLMLEKAIGRLIEMNKKLRRQRNLRDKVWRQRDRRRFQNKLVKGRKL